MQMIGFLSFVSLDFATCSSEIEEMRKRGGGYKCQYSMLYKTVNPIFSELLWGGGGGKIMVAYTKPQLACKPSGQGCYR